MKRHMDRARDSLGELAGLANRTEAAERQILQRAEQLLDEVNAEIEKLRPGVEGAPDESQSRYLHLITERGQLHQVIANAKAALGQ